jgi:hypothetical protein
MARFNMCGRFTPRAPEPPARESLRLDLAVTGKQASLQLLDSECSAELVSYPVSTLGELTGA